MKPKNYGLLQEPIIIDKDYQLGGYGSLGGTIFQESGQWLDYIPMGEKQSNFGFDAQGCVSWAFLNAVEITLRRMYQVTENFSDRFLAKISLTTPQGNTPQKVAEALRKNGVCREVLWPITKDQKTWESFYVEPPQEVKVEAKKFLTTFTFNHEYVGTSPAQLMAGLKLSPLVIGVSAWSQNDEGLYVSDFPNNHAVVLIGYVKDKKWIIFDSYPESEGDFIKELAWDHEISVAKRIAINLYDQQAQLVWWVLLWNGLTSFFNKWFHYMYGLANKAIK